MYPGESISVDLLLDPRQGPHVTVFIGCFSFSQFSFPFNCRTGLALSLERGGFVTLDVRCHILGTAVAHFHGVGVEDLVQE